MVFSVKFSLTMCSWKAPMAETRDDSTDSAGAMPDGRTYSPLTPFWGKRGNCSPYMRPSPFV